MTDNNVMVRYAVSYSTKVIKSKQITTHLAREFDSVPLYPIVQK